jgi:hypothetical protein
MSQTQQGLHYMGLLGAEVGVGNLQYSRHERLLLAVSRGTSSGNLSDATRNFSGAFIQQISPSIATIHRHHVIPLDLVNLVYTDLF